MMNSSPEIAGLETSGVSAAADFRLFAVEARQLIDAALDRVLPSESIPPERVHAAIRWSVFAGGKRFRPILLLAVGETFGAGRELLSDTACALELIHTYSLIHDDLPSMDNDDLRRGRATCHVRFGEANAILAGDALQTLAFKLVAEDQTLSADKRVLLIAEIARRCRRNELSAASPGDTHSASAARCTAPQRCLECQSGAGPIASAPVRSPRAV